MKIKKMIALTSAAALLLGMATVGANASTEFSDLATTNWAHDAVVNMTDSGIIKGYPDGTFRPQGTVTYGEFIKMAVVEYLGEDTVGNTKENGKNWADGYYEEAVRIGLFTEEQISKDQLNKGITRADMAVISSNAITKEVGNKSFSDEEFNKLYASISDVNKDSDNSEAIAKAYGFGLLTGYKNGTFKPDGTLTRSESAMVIYRLIDSSAREYPNLEEPTAEDIGDVTCTPIEQLYESGGIVKSMKITDVIKQYGMYNYIPDGYDPETEDSIMGNPMHGKTYTGIYASYDSDGKLVPNYYDSYYSLVWFDCGGDGVMEDTAAIKKLVDDDVYDVRNLTNCKIVKSTPVKFYKTLEFNGDEVFLMDKDCNELGFGFEQKDKEKRDCLDAFVICGDTAYKCYSTPYNNSVSINSSGNLPYGTIKFPADYDYLGIYSATGDTAYLIPKDLINYEYVNTDYNTVKELADMMKIERIY